MRIPVGYKLTPVEKVKIDDYLPDVGKIIDKWFSTESYLSPDENIYEMDVVILVTESVVEGEYFQNVFTVTDLVKVLKYARVPKAEKPFEMKAVNSLGTTDNVLFSSHS